MKERKFRFPVTSLAGSSVPNFIRICRHHRVDLPYYPKLALSFIVACIFELFNLWERIMLRRRMKKTEIKQPPVFIIGFWRSGTTLLHNLLCSHPGAAYTTTFQTVFPLVTITQAWWLKKIINYLVPKKRPFDNVSMDMDFPQEEEFAMANLQHLSLYNFFVFPKDFDRFVEKELFTSTFTGKELESWKGHYNRMIKKAMINTGGSRYISKNPCNMIRIRLLKEMFPEAKFIFIHRNPYAVVESLYRFVLSIFPGIKVQEVPDSFTREKISGLYGIMMRDYFTTRSGLQPEDLIEIRMEDFMKDKTGTLGKIYRQFKIADFEQAMPYFEKYLADHSTLSRDPYKIQEETYYLLNDHHRDIIEMLGYKILRPEMTEVTV
jgi:hypothetical protein